MSDTGIWGLLRITRLLKNNFKQNGCVTILPCCTPNVNCYPVITGTAWPQPIKIAPSLVQSFLYLSRWERIVLKMVMK